MIVSSHNPRTIYFGGNHLFKSVDRGDTWKIISPDLTTNDPEKRNSSDSGGLTHEVTGAENHCTIISISESPLDLSILWAGTDDGNVQVTKDGGINWKNVRPNISGVPQGIWVSRVEASHFHEGSAYVTFDGHRSDINRTYLNVQLSPGASETISYIQYGGLVGMGDLILNVKMDGITIIDNAKKQVTIQTSQKRSFFAATPDVNTTGFLIVALISSIMLFLRKRI